MMVLKIYCTQSIGAQVFLNSPNTTLGDDS